MVTKEYKILYKGDLVKIPFVLGIGETVAVNYDKNLFNVFPKDVNGHFVPAYSISNPSNTVYGYVEFIGDYKEESICTFEVTNSNTVLETVLVKKEIERNTSKNNGVIFNKDKFNNNLVENINIERSDSFQVIRTNPLLTGNVKITLDSSDNITLNSFDTNTELSNAKYKGFKTSPSNTYASDLRKCFGALSNNIFFDVNQQVDHYTTSNKFLEQYERFYTSGFYRTNSKLYTEQFSILAPLYVNTKLPKYFVVFKAYGAINKSIENGVYSFDINSDILSNCKIIKKFDVAGGNIGKYLANSLDSSDRTSDLKVNLDKGSYTKFCGFDIKNGVYSEASELLFDFYNKETSITNLEKYITEGFSRNGIVSSHLFNLEFLFDDEDTNEYSINRYFGLYCEDIDLLDFKLNSEAQKLDVSQTPLDVNGKLSLFTNESWTQQNQDGINLWTTKDDVKSLSKRDKKLIFSSKVISSGKVNDSIYLEVNGDFKARDITTDSFKIVTTFNTIDVILDRFEYDFYKKTAKIWFLIDHSQIDITHADTYVYYFNNTPTFIDFYNDTDIYEFDSKLLNDKFLVNRILVVKDKEDNFYNIKGFKDLSVKDYLVDLDCKKITLFDEVVDLGKFKGAGQMLTRTASSLKNSRSTITLQIISNLNESDEFEIFIDGNNSNNTTPTKWKISFNPTGLNEGEYWKNDYVYNDDNSYYMQVNIHPGTSGVDHNAFSKLICEAINSFDYSVFEAFSIENWIMLRAKEYGSAGNLLRLGINLLDTSKLYVNESVSNNGIYKFGGGSNLIGNTAEISIDVAKGILDGEIFASGNKFVELERYTEFEQLRTWFYSDDEKTFRNKANIVLENKSKFYRSSDGKITSYELFRPKVSILSFLSIKDFDYSINDSDYNSNYFEEIKAFAFHEDYYKIILQSDNVGSLSDEDFVTELVVKFISNTKFDHCYLYNGSGDVFLIKIINGSLVGLPELFNSTNEVIISLNPHLLKNNINDYNSIIDVNTFKGFQKLEDIVTNEELVEFNNKVSLNDPSRFNINTLDSEYYRLSEQYNSKYATYSKTTPLVCKWIKKGSDVRNNSYRLNLSRAFGHNGFSPNYKSKDLVSGCQYEFPFISGVPSVILREKTNTNSYIFDDIEFYDFYSTEFDYFNEYFTGGFPLDIISNELSGDYDFPSYTSTSKRFTSITLNKYTGNCETFFRGSKLVFEGNTYEGYNFSVVYCNSKNSYKKENDLEVIINNKFNFIVIKIVLNYKTLLGGGLTYLEMYQRKTSSQYFFSTDDSVSPISTNIEPYISYKRNLGKGSVQYYEKGTTTILDDSVNNIFYKFGLFYSNNSGASVFDRPESNNWVIDSTFDVSEVKFDKIVESFSNGVIANEINSDGSINQTTLRFDYEIPKQFELTTFMYPIIDSNIPSVLRNSGTIGSTLAEYNSNELINRYDGEFDIKFKDIVEFNVTEIADFEFLSGKRFLNFNTYFLNIYEINEFYNKIADSEILKIGNSGGYKSDYPLIDEVSISNKTSNIWSSSWDKNYFIKYSDTKTFSYLDKVPLYEEIPSFFGSKAIKIPNSFRLEEFNNNELTWTESGNNINVKVDLYSRLLRLLLEDDKLGNEFKKYKNYFGENYLDFAKNYFITNLLKYIKVEKINVLVLNTSLKTYEVIEFENGISFNSSKLYDANFISTNQVKTTYSTDLNFSFDYTSDTRFFTSIGVFVDLLVE